MGSSWVERTNFNEKEFHRIQNYKDLLFYKKLTNCWPNHSYRHNMRCSFQQFLSHSHRKRICIRPRFGQRISQHIQYLTFSSQVLHNVHQLVRIDGRIVELLFNAITLRMRKCCRNISESLQVLHVVCQSQHLSGSTNVDESYVAQAGIEANIGSGMNDQFHIGAKRLSICGAKAEAYGAQVSQNGMDTFQEAGI